MNSAAPGNGSGAYCSIARVAVGLEPGLSSPTMSERIPLYSVRPDDTIEVQRALRICLCGMRPPSALSCGAGSFSAWAQGEFLRVIAPHVIRVHAMALAGDAKAVAATDAALALREASTSAGRALLATRSGARPLPVMKKFAAAVEDGSAHGHFATVMALHGADFSIALLPLLQCVLYCEWRAVQPAGASLELGDFFRCSGSLLPALASLLFPHAKDSATPAASMF